MAINVDRSKKVRGYTCPACSSKLHYTVQPSASLPISVARNIVSCAKCGAFHGHCYKGDSYLIVKPWFGRDEVPVEHQRYYDLQVLGSNGIERRHGWFDIETGLITQVG